MLVSDVMCVKTGDQAPPRSVYRAAGGPVWAEIPAATRAGVPKPWSCARGATDSTRARPAR